MWQLSHVLHVLLCRAEIDLHVLSVNCGKIRQFVACVGSLGTSVHWAHFKLKTCFTQKTFFRLKHVYFVVACLVYFHFKYHKIYWWFTLARWGSHMILDGMLPWQLVSTKPLLGIIFFKDNFLIWKCSIMQ